MKLFNVAQDLVIVFGGGLLLWAGVIAKEPLNIVLSGVFMLFGMTALFFDVMRKNHE